MPKAPAVKPPKAEAELSDAHIHVHGPPQPYLIFTDVEGVPHFMEFAGVHLYCVSGRHHVQDRFGRHHEVAGAYDIMDPQAALQAYQMMCAAAAAAQRKGG